MSSRTTTPANRIMIIRSSARRRPGRVDVAFDMYHFFNPLGKAIADALREEARERGVNARVRWRTNDILRVRMSIEVPPGREDEVYKAMKTFATHVRKGLYDDIWKEWKKERIAELSIGECKKLVGG